MASVLRHALLRRPIAFAWWLVGIIGVAALLAIAYPTVRGNASLDSSIANLPKSVQASIGLGSGKALSSSVGYLDSQYFANLLPILLLVFAMAYANWAIAGDESAGTLELLLANPVRRWQVATARLVALIVRVGILGAASVVVLIALAPLTKLNVGLPASHVLAATIGTCLLALTFASVTFAISAATGLGSVAIGVSAALAVFGLVVEGLAEQVPALHAVRAASPWHWLLDSDPLQHGMTWPSILLPLASMLVLAVLGIVGFQRRDLR